MSRVCYVHHHFYVLPSRNKNNLFFVSCAPEKIGSGIISKTIICKVLGPYKGISSEALKFPC